MERRRSGTWLLLGAVLTFLGASGTVLSRAPVSDVERIVSRAASGTGSVEAVGYAVEPSATPHRSHPVAAAVVPSGEPDRPRAAADRTTIGVHHGSAAPSTPAELAPPGSRGEPGRPSATQSARNGLTRRESINFSSKCKLARQAADDPIVYPRMPGASHPHDFFGSRTTNAFSTHDTLRGSETTCHLDGDSSAYWVPALSVSGARVAPTSVTAYYRPGAKDHRTIEPFPPGLKVIAFDAARARWLCLGGAEAEVHTSAPTCAEGRYLGMRIVFPDCWDAVYLDVPDHRAHMAYASSKGCPASHPAPVPQLTLDVRYDTTRGGAVTLGEPGHAVEPHGDFINAWDPGTLKRHITDCINAGAHCAGRPPG